MVRGLNSLLSVVKQWDNMGWWCQVTFRCFINDPPKGVPCVVSCRIVLETAFQHGKALRIFLAHSNYSFLDPEQGARRDIPMIGRRFGIVRPWPHQKRWSKSSPNRSWDLSASHAIISNTHSKTSKHLNLIAIPVPSFSSWVPFIPKIATWQFHVRGGPGTNNQWFETELGWQKL